MAVKTKAPYVCHILVCAHDRGGKKKSCGDGEGQWLRKMIKEEVSKRGWKESVRVSQTGCLGICDDGPVVVVYPGDIWYGKVSRNDVKSILPEVERELKKSTK